MATNTRSRSSSLRLKTSSSSSSFPDVTRIFPPNHRSCMLSPQLKRFHDRVFTDLAQSPPHFSPLGNIRSETVKEGIKLGWDVAFMNFVMKFPNLVDSTDFLTKAESFTEEFQQFEDMGYDLTKVKERFILLKARAEAEKGSNDEIEKLETVKKQREAEIQEKQCLLVDLEKNTARVAAEVEGQRSEIVTIEFKKRKILEESEINLIKFRNLAAQAWF